MATEGKVDGRQKRTRHSATTQDNFPPEDSRVSKAAAQKCNIKIMHITELNRAISTIQTRLNKHDYVCTREHVCYIRTGVDTLALPLEPTARAVGEEECDPGASRMHSKVIQSKRETNV